MGLGVLLVAAALYKGRHLLLYLLLGMALVATVRAVGAAFENRAVASRWVKAGLLTAGGAVLAGASLLALTAWQQLPTLVRLFAATYRAWIDRWAEGSRLEQFLAKALGAFVDKGDRGRLALVATGQAVDGLLAGIIVLVLAIYWARHRKSLAPLAVQVFPLPIRATMRRLGADVELGVGLHILKELCESAVVALVLTGVFRIIGLPLASLLACAVALLRVIPLAGIPLALILVAAVGVNTSGRLALEAAGGTVGIVWLAGMGVERALGVRRYNQVLVILCLFLLFRLFGWFGLLLAPPVGAALQISLETAVRWRRQRQIEALRTPPIPRDLAEVGRRLAELQVRIASQPRPISTTTLNAFARLRHLYARMSSGKPVSQAGEPPGRGDDTPRAGEPTRMLG